MDDRTPIKERRLPLRYPHNPTGTEAQENDYTRGEIRVFERDGRPPVFVVYESHTNLGPPLESITRKYVDAMKMHYHLEPQEILWFEKPLDSEHYEQVRFGTLGTDGKTANQWTENKREQGITKVEIERTIASGLLEEPEKRERVKRPDHWKEGELPKLTIEERISAVEEDKDLTPRR